MFHHHTPAALLVTLLVAAPMGAVAAEVSAVHYVPVQTSTQAQRHSADATVEAVRDAQLAAQVTGSIVGIDVRVGEHVKAGQELLRIDARMASQSASASQAQVAAAQAQAQVAAREYERQQQLYAKRYVSQAALDHARAQWRASQAQVRALQAQAGVAATQSGLHVLRAPFDGIVSAAPTATGDMALPGKPLVGLYDPARLRVSAALTGAQVARLRAGASVQLELSGAGERITVAGADVQALPTADAHSRTVTVRVPLPPQTQGAVPGSFARLWFGGAGGGPERYFVPATSVVRRAEMTGVYVQGASGQPQLRQVRLGQMVGEQIEVLSGVSAGEQVATDPQAAATVR